MNLQIVKCCTFKALLAACPSELESSERFVALNKLLKQLSPENPGTDINRIRRFFNSGGTLFLLIVADKIVGMATLLQIADLDSFGGLIDNVVIDADHRRKGYGRKLLQRIFYFAKLAGMEWVDLDSRPSRIEANQMYLALGFTRIDTNMYTFKLSTGA